VRRTVTSARPPGATAAGATVRLTVAGFSGGWTGAPGRGAVAVRAAAKPSGQAARASLDRGAAIDPAFYGGNAERVIPVVGPGASR
jgi:hypothetical protein